MLSTVDDGFASCVVSLLGGLITIALMLIAVGLLCRCGSGIVICDRHGRLVDVSLSSLPEMVAITTCVVVFVLVVYPLASGDTD